eukprot:2408566-Ditylum_brightwellii.AAC.1
MEKTKEIPGSSFQRNGSEVKDCVLTVPSFYTHMTDEGSWFFNDVEWKWLAKKAHDKATEPSQMTPSLTSASSSIQ